MKVAVPVADGKLCMHFGHCEQFAVVRVEEPTKQTDEVVFLTPPPHEPGVLPRWLSEQGITAVIAGGMGMRAQQLFEQYGIQVIVGAPSESPREIVQKWLEGSLSTGDNACEH